MNDALRLEIEAEALAASPNECFGFIVRSFASGGLQRVPCRNVAEEPAEHAIPAVSDAQTALLTGEVLSTYHSHPNALETPSEADLRACEESEVPYHIFSLLSQQWYTLRPSCAPEMPYVGREFAFGITDCYTLVQDYYRREFKLVLPHLPRRDEFWLQDNPIFMQTAYEEGFRPVTDDVRVGDIFLFCVASKPDRPNHLGVYVGCGHFLHHLYSRLSCQDSLVGSWSRRIHSRYRHSSLCLPQSISTAA
jgi:proteasome lid subunit RPN8/RPN11